MTANAMAELKEWTSDVGRWSLVVGCWLLIAERAASGNCLV